MNLFLAELAENAHDVWAATRMGPKRDDETKRHTCLVPYCDLPGPEKEYDRRTAAKALKAIHTLGYRITPPGKEL